MSDKLVYILPEYDPQTGSHLHYEYKLLEKLNKQFDLRVIVERGPEIDGLPTYCQRYSLPPLRMIELLAVLLVFRVQGYNVTYTHYSNYGALSTGILSSVFGGLSLYWNCGEMEEARSQAPEDLGDMLTRIKSRVGMRLSLLTTDILVTGTSIMKDYYAETYGVPREKIRTLPNWVDRERFTEFDQSQSVRGDLGLPDDRPVVLYLHRVVDHKGADTIPEIAETVIDEYPDVLFVVVGDGPYRDNLANDIHDRGLTENVSIEGRVPNQRAIKYFSAADLYIMPSRSEGFPRVILEAMAARCPFVSTDAGGVREIVPEAYRKHIVPRGDWRLFARTIVGLLEDEDERGRLSEAGWERAGYYDRDRVCDRLQDIIEAGCSKSCE